MPRYRKENSLECIQDLSFAENEQSIQRIIGRLRALNSMTYTAELCRREGKRLAKLRFRGVPFFVTNDFDAAMEAIKWHKRFRHWFQELGIPKSQQSWDYTPPAMPTAPPKQPKPYEYKNGGHGIVLRGYEYHVFYRAQKLGISFTKEEAHRIMREHIQFLADGRAYKRNQKVSA